MLSKLLKHVSPIDAIRKIDKESPASVAGAVAGYCMDDCFAAPFYANAQLVWEKVGKSSGSGRECEAFRNEPTKRLTDGNRAQASTLLLNSDQSCSTEMRYDGGWSMARS